VVSLAGSVAGDVCAQVSPDCCSWRFCEGDQAVSHARRSDPSQRNAPARPALGTRAMACYFPRVVRVADLLHVVVTNCTLRRQSEVPAALPVAWSSRCRPARIEAPGAELFAGVYIVRQVSAQLRGRLPEDCKLWAIFRSNSCARRMPGGCQRLQTPCNVGAPKEEVDRLRGSVDFITGHPRQ
jgi:hypothetical protein